MVQKIVLRGNSAKLAALLNVTDRRVRQLAETEVLTRQPEGDFILPDAIAEYYAYKFQTKEDLDYMAEKTRHEKAKRELTELELARRQGQVHDAADVELVMMNMLSNLRAQLLAVPSKMAPQLAERDSGFISAALEREIKERLAELSDYSPDLFAPDDVQGDK